MKKLILLSLTTLFLTSCGKNGQEHDASGIFEATEVIISAESNGKLLSFTVSEGAELKAGQVVGQLDCKNLDLQKAQAEASLSAVRQKTNDASPQVAILKEQLKAQQQVVNVQREQLRVLEKEVARLQNLVKAEAATRKQLDDAEGQASVLKQQITASEATLAVLQQQIKSQEAAVGIQNRGILSETQPMNERVAQFNDLLSRCTVTNPIDGTVLVKYAQANEVMGAGKALYKIADMRIMTLRAYVTGDQLAKIKLNQNATVSVDDGQGGFRGVEGTVTYISDKAEFTPKTIQTKDERANLVYAIKISVPNAEKLLKIGMYGEVLFR